MNAAEVIVCSLEKHGVEYVFGVPGGAIEPLNSALHKSRIKVIVAKHEEGAAFMADGYARISGNLGVCCSTSGPGATNMITGLASSHADSIPVIALTGQVATSVFGKGAIQELSIQSFGIVSMFRQISKYSDIIINENKAGEMITKARRLAMTGRKGPVHLNLPADIMKKKVSDDAHERCSITQVLGFDRAGVKEAARILLNAKRPVIVAGWGTVLSRADEELLELAELLDIPVATSPKAKGILSETHPLSLGVLGFAGSPVAREYITNDVDVMLAIGTSFNEWVTSGWDKRLLPKSLIHIDIDCSEIGKNFYVDVGIAGDAKIIMHELVHELLRQHKLRRALGNARQQEVLELRKNCGPKTKKMHDTPYHPLRLITDLSQALPEDTIYFADNGNSMAWAIRHLTVTRPYSFFVGLGFASMGFATAASVGAKLAAGERPVVALVGDGSFLMNGMEIATAVEYNIPVIWVVMNNSMLGMVYHGRKLLQNPESGMKAHFKTVDFVKVAEGLGARGIRISKPGEINRKLMDEIIAAGVPTVLDVTIDPEVVPPIHSRITSLEKLYT